jgi:nucleoside phosphorylase
LYFLEKRYVVKPVKSILIMIAMRAEAREFIQALGLKQEEHAFDEKLPMRAYSGTVDSLSVVVVLNGVDKRFDVDDVATQPAVLATYVGVQKFNPDLIINAGTAGGFKRADYEIGDAVVSCGSVKFHDRRIPLKGFDAYGIGSYPCIDMPDLIEELSLKQGIISTGNSLDCTQTDMEMIEKNGAEIKEMEAAGIAWVAWILEKPFMAVKTISDFIDSHEPSEEQFVRNLGKATGNLSNTLVKIVDYLNVQGK